ncbi:MAG: hypothetical protein AVDCRST_MAG35-748, partial [uncultured Quadrisphaera sp.]
ERPDRHQRPGRRSPRRRGR